MVAYRQPGPLGSVNEPIQFGSAKRGESAFSSPRNDFVPGPAGLKEIRLDSYIKSLLTPKPTKTVKVLKFLTKWGRNASPFNIAYNLIFKLHWTGVSYWMDVRKAAEAGHKLKEYIDDLEKIALALKTAADQQYSAYLDLPDYPLQTYDKAGYALVTATEMQYVEEYFNSAVMIANDAMSTRTYLNRAIKGWDDVLVHANKISNFTRKFAWEAITMLEMRFTNKGGSFRGFLVEARDRANLVESRVRDAQYLAAHILGKPVPGWYQPPKGWY